jgi:sec-independent protein translocase protein TatA
MPNLGATEIIIIAVVVLVLFGSKKLPEASRSLGRSLRIFKAETKALRDDDATPAPSPAAAPALPAIAPTPVAPSPTPSVNGVQPADVERH